jgi:hypothetical protein
MSVDNRTLILDEFEELKGQFVINDSRNIERLIAIGEDDSDYYYVTYDGRRLRWSSCVGRIMPLKGYLRDKDYAEFIRMAKLNHFDQPTLWGKMAEEEGEFANKHKEEMLSLKGDDKFISEVFWDLN